MTILNVLATIWLYTFNVGLATLICVGIIFILAVVIGVIGDAIRESRRH